MATKYLDSNGLLYLWQKIRNTFVSDVTWDSSNKKLVKKKKTGASGEEVSTDLVTFASVATSGSYNDLSNKPTIPTLKNVFGKVKVGSTTIEADTTQDTLELVAGSNVTLTPDATNDKVTIASSAGGFIATYNSTTYAEISAAIAAGESVFVYISGTNSYLDGKFGYLANTSASSYEFINIAFSTTISVTYISCDSSNEWSAYSEGLIYDTTVNNVSVVENGTAKITLGGAASKGVVTSISSDSSDLPTVTAVKSYVATAVSGAASFQGTAPTTFAPTNYKAGYYWVIGTAGTYAGQTCEAGDMIFAIADGTSYSASNFDVVQTNLDITSITNGDIDTIVAS